jgi:hypothetical protein
LSRVKRCTKIRFLWADGTCRTWLRVRGLVEVGIMEVPMRAMSIPDPFAV